MQKVIFLILFIVFSFISQAQDCFWAKKYGGNNSDAIYSIATDTHNNVYATGLLQSTGVVFGTYTLSATAFIAKYDAKGNIKWAKGMHGAGGAETWGITVDKDGNAIVTGSFGGSPIFGSDTLKDYGNGGFFVAKYDSMGNSLWGRAIATRFGEFGYDVTTDSNGDVYAVGTSYGDTIVFAGDTFYNASIGLSSYGVPDVLIAKFDASGNPQWAKFFGGRNYDEAYGVICDRSNNVYVGGVFENDTITIGTNILTNSLSAGTFLTKMDANGNVIWAKDYNSGAGNLSGGDAKLAMDTSANIYISGAFSSNYILLGPDSIINHGQGATDIYTAKFDSSGTGLWARGCGGGNYDYGKDISVDAKGNSYIIGIYSSYKFIAGLDTLSNPVNSYINFLVKYDNSGNQLLVKNIPGSSYNQGRSVACGTGQDTYFGGSFNGSMTFGNTTLNSGGYSNIFLADLFEFNSGLTSYTNVSCNGGNDGQAVAFAASGHLPYSYSWNSSPVQTNDTAYNLAAGNYQLSVTEGYGCTQTANFAITEPPADSLHICMVTVDSASQHNIIVWDKTSWTDVDSFIIYREIGTNNYQPIASVPYDSLSEFVDTVRTLYFPNTGDPNAGTYRYKLRAHTSCGLYTGLSPFHNTIYFLNNNGTFYWVQPYTIQGSPNPVTSYILERDDNSTGAWHAVSSVAGTQQLVSDPLYSIYQNIASWRVKTQWNITCAPTLRLGNNSSLSNYNTSISNIFSNVGVGIKSTSWSSQVKIYPTINAGNFIIETPVPNCKIEIYSILGELIYSSIQQKEKAEINLPGLQKGVCMVHVISAKGTVVKRIVIE